ncbi:sensor histidine kinase [Bacillus sp. FSL K6-3431]|uniref:sensor histidine kinase n=1 Tax=Bacillus sp. FSL K6-3431 TaxID=2921500 RepID=UPI0030F58ACC
MYKIKTKLMLFFILLFIVLNSLSIFLFYSHKQTIKQYDHILNRFFLLNNVSKSTNDAYESMNLYLNSNRSNDLDDYRDQRSKLILFNKKMEAEIKNNQNKVSVDNYQNMVNSLVQESDLAIDNFSIGDIESYSMQQREALKLLGFIQEETLLLLNNELTDFHSFYGAMSKRNSFMNSMGIAMFSGTFLTGFLFAFLFSNSITKPIHQLTTTAREIAKGKLDGKDIRSSRKDELGFLTQTFNQMRGELDYHVRQIKSKSEQEKLLKEMELKSLQSQINPHFLFNTLNTISKTAYLDGSDHISNLITSLSKLLRYNLSHIEKPVTLLDEINIVKEYFFIQKARFEERVQFSIDIPEDCLSVQMPILTLQPLVENAFIHGIEPFEKQGKIEINAYKEDEDVFVLIRDNGIGIDEQTMNLLKDRSLDRMPKFEGHSTGIGLNNVIRRLEMYYQSGQAVSIFSEKDKGTTIKIKLSVHPVKEANHV